jgi:hypothetical protein
VNPRNLSCWRIVIANWKKSNCLLEKRHWPLFASPHVTHKSQPRPMTWNRPFFPKRRMSRTSCLNSGKCRLDKLHSSQKESMKFTWIKAFPCLPVSIYRQQPKRQWLINWVWPRLATWRIAFCFVSRPASRKDSLPLRIATIGAQPLVTNSATV